MTDDNVHSLRVERMLRPAVEAVGKLHDALHEQARILARTFGISNTLGFSYLCQFCEMQNTGGPETYVQSVQELSQILQRLPKQATRDLKERWTKLDAVYGGAQGASDVAHAMIDRGATREVIELFFDLGTGYFDEAKEIEAKGLMDVVNEIMAKLNDDTDRFTDTMDYLAVLEIVREWYT